jgi:hypothetical protein
MDKKIHIPQKMAELLHDNYSLKVLTLGSIVISSLLLLIVLIQVVSGPMIVPVDATTGAKVGTLPGLWNDDSVTEAVKTYLKYRYCWNPQNQSGQVSMAKKFITSGSVSAFEKTAADLKRFSKDKNVSQRVYDTEIKVDLAHNTAHVFADRFNEIQGLKAASILNVNLFFEKGKPTVENPWGFYVSKEEEIVPQ